MDDEPPHIRLSPLGDEHITRLLPLSGDPVLLQTMGWKPFDSDEDERFINYVQNVTVPNLFGGRTIALAILSADDDKPIGYLSLKGVREGGTAAEIGIAIMDAEYRGRGFGTEALRQAAAYAFSELEVSHLVLTVFPDNVPAMRSYEKLGFKTTEVLKESWELPDETFADMWVMELTREEFESKTQRAGSSANSH
jgi:RimJ/RimL family protein N-acetyltransferase